MEEYKMYDMKHVGKYNVDFEVRYYNYDELKKRITFNDRDSID